MKKNRLLSLFLALVMLFGLVSALGGSAMAADVAINATNFPDANFRKVIKTFDADNNDYFSVAERTGVIAIECSEKNIADLKGIEHFTGLKKLYCENNKLTSLDVSHNTALTSLDCDNNHLKSLDVSRNTALEYLRCRGNLLTSLDVSRNTALRSLICDTNQLMSLDVSRNTALLLLWCQRNQLTSLDVSRNTALKELICGGNQLTRLDVSRNTELTYLSCNDNKLTSLDVSAALAIRDAVVNGTKYDLDVNYYIYKSEHGELYVDKTVAIATSTLTGKVTISPLNPTRNSTITSALGGTLQSIPANKLHYQWQTARPNSTSFINLAGETSASKKIGADIDPGWQYRLVVTADGFTGSVVSNVVTVQEALSGSVYISPSSPKAGETMTAYLSGSVWALPSEKVHYQWRYSVGNTRYINIEGATGKTYTVPSSTPAGYKYEVVVTADGHDGSLISEPVTAAAAPALSGTVRISPTSPKAGETLTISLSGTVGSIPSSKLHYQWRSAASNARFSSISGATNSTYTIPTSTSAGYRYEVYVTADGYEGTLVSNTATVVDGTPTISGKATVSPTNPKVGDTLRITLSGGLENISARNIKYQWQYTTGNSRYSGIRTATGSTYKIPDSAQPGYKYRVAITADGYTGTIYSDPVTVTAASAYPKGDVDRSGQVGNSDLIMVARHVVHILTLTGEQFTLGDMNDDKIIDNKDIITLAKKIVGM